jgi:hypothetical protein
VNPCRIDGNNALGADSLSGPPDDPGFPRREIRTHDARQSTGHESAGRWPAVFIDDMQQIVDSYDPAG